MAKYKNTKQIAKSVKKESSDFKLHKHLITIPLIALFIKFIIMANTPGGGWFGADGENYANGVDALLTEGFFSSESTLNYWPAGYPLLMWPLALISVSKFYFLLSVVQSIFFAFSTYYLTKGLMGSSLKFLAFWVSIFISFNPTLSLSTLVAGYEAPIASCLMMAAGIVLANYGKTQTGKMCLPAMHLGFWLSVATFLQPRYVVVGIAMVLIWSLRFVGKKSALKFASLAIAVMLIAPTILVFRNSVAIDQATISTNLGVTMRIGAGPETSGGYQHTGPQVPCEPPSGEGTVSDGELVRCVISWYLSNPVDTVRLSINKALFYWSPWSGPEVEGTMARNPWLKISPAHQIATSSEGGRSLVYGPIGILISWGWIIAQIATFCLGYLSLRRKGSSEKFVANLVAVPVVLSWLISIGTIGDHRFRIPTMGFSLLLQVAAILALRKKFTDKVG